MQIQYSLIFAFIPLALEAVVVVEVGVIIVAVGLVVVAERLAS